MRFRWESPGSAFTLIGRMSIGGDGEWDSERDLS